MLKLVRCSSDTTLWTNFYFNSRPSIHIQESQILSKMALLYDLLTEELMEILIWDWRRPRWHILRFWVEELIYRRIRPMLNVAMNQLGTVYATKRRRRNGKRWVTALNLRIYKISATIGNDFEFLSWIWIWERSVPLSCHIVSQFSLIKKVIYKENRR